MGCCPCFAGVSPPSNGTVGVSPPSKGTLGVSPPSNGTADARNEKRQQHQNLLEHTLDFIAKVPLFQAIPLSEHRKVAEAFTLQEFQEGSAVINQGEIGDTFYVVRSGNAKVVVDGKHVNTLNEGDFFGELALLHNTARNATITATGGNLRCQVMTRENFQQLELNTKLNFKKRNAVIMAESDYQSASQATAKTSADVLFIKEALMADNNIGTFCKSLSELQLQEISDSAFLKEVSANTAVITQGDANADLFYILKEGAAQAIKDGQQVASYVGKGSFGGLALMYSAPRAATVRVTSRSKLWCIPRAAMRAVLQQEVKNKVATYAKLLDRLKLFSGMSAESKLDVADALVETTYTKDQLVTKQGEESTALFILQSGILAEKNIGKPPDIITAEHRLHCFGQDELLKEIPYAISRQVLSPKAVLLVLNRDMFQIVFKKCGMSHLFDKTQDLVEYKRSELSTIGLLGCGAFGKVTLVKYGQSGQHFALKAVSKGFIVKMNQKRSIMNEKAIMHMINCPFLVQVAATFNTDQHLMFLMELCLGGELFTVYMEHRLHGKENHAMFYTACAIKGLQHLHERCIIYRDMKPENLLLDNKGYCKIADFGLAKFSVGKTFTSCGTPEYFAPELVKGIGHTTSLDWWTLGILTYELMMSVTPFAADDEPQMYTKILKGLDDSFFPQLALYGNRRWPDFVKEMCQTDPAQRLPVRPGGKTSLEQHDWFKEARFNWGHLLSWKMPAPFSPKVTRTDTSNFSACPGDSPPQVAYYDTGDGWDADFEEVFGPAVFQNPGESPKEKADHFKTVGGGSKKRKGCSCIPQ